MYFPKSAESCTLVNKSVEFDMDYTPSVLAKDIVRKANQKHQCDERWMGTLESAKHTYPNIKHYIINTMKLQFPSEYSCHFRESYPGGG
jgi:DNA polymerase III alpha subunit (gram-positive type)